ncbi:MAG: RES family NAD+ phosphorylase [Acidobacteriota bacterium]|nr:RES family NAD+ phosphorylase [Acidobacteriota bacterium]
MSWPTWTLDALSSERRRLSGRCWRVVEAQHRVSTMKLVDSVAQQDLLERTLEQTKPPVPAGCRHLHYLLSTPFRYGAPYPRGSRFRRAGPTRGVFYGSRTPTTAVAEMAFHRLLFFAESPRTPWPPNAGEFTAFAVDLRTRSALDLTSPPFVAHRQHWTSRTDYAASQELADQGRAAGVEVIKYESARDAARGVNLAVLDCRPFTSPQPIERQTWRIDLGPSGVRALCAFPETRLEFERAAFADDPRIAALMWDR